MDVLEVAHLMLAMNWGDLAAYSGGGTEDHLTQTFLVVSSAQLNDKFTRLISTDCYACYYMHIWKLLNCTAFFKFFFYKL